MTIKKRKKRKLTKLQEEYKDVKDFKEYLRKKSEAQGVYGIKDDFNSKFFTWLSVILIIVAIVYFTDNSNNSNVDECQKGVFNLLPCHCYSANDPNIPSACN